MKFHCFPIFIRKAFCPLNISYVVLDTFRYFGHTLKVVLLKLRQGKSYEKQLFL